MLKRWGPLTLPWVVPLLTGFQSHSELLQDTLCFLSFKRRPTVRSQMYWQRQPDVSPVLCWVRSYWIIIKTQGQVCCCIPVEKRTNFSRIMQFNVWIGRIPIRWTEIHSHLSGPARNLKINCPFCAISPKLISIFRHVWLTIQSKLKNTRITETAVS